MTYFKINMANMATVARARNEIPSKYNENF